MRFRRWLCRHSNHLQRLHVTFASNDYKRKHCDFCYESWNE